MIRSFAPSATSSSTALHLAASTLLVCLAAAAAQAQPLTEGPLPAAIQYKVDQHLGALDGIEELIATSKFDRAKRSLESLTKTYGLTKEWNKEKVSPDHPIFKGIDERLAKLQASFDEKMAEAAKLAAALQPVIEAIEESTPPMENAVRDGRFALMGLSSMEGHYSQYRDPKKIEEKLNILREKVAAANALTPPADNLVTHFRQQYPSEDELKKVLPKKADDIHRAVNKLARHLDTWAEVKDRAVKKINDDAQANIEEAVAKLKSKTKADRLSASGHAEMWAIGYNGPLLEAVDIIYPVDEKNADSAVALTKEQQARVDRAHELKKQVAGVVKTVKKIKKGKADAAKKKIKEARFPSGAKPLSTNKAGVLKALKGEFGKPLRTGAASSWQARREARWVNDHWDVGVFNYLDVWIAAKTPKGKYRVYRTTVRQRKQPNGSWGPVRYWSVGHSYELLKKNIKK